MQIYKEMNIGTAKVTKQEMQEIKHYMIDFVSPEERFSVSDYKAKAEKAIEMILKNKKKPIIVGGTGLYIDSLIYGIKFSQSKIDLEYRTYLRKLADEQGLDVLYNMALKIDKEAMKKISKNDRKRIIRVLEIYQETGKTKTEIEKFSRQEEVKYDYKVFAINMDREKLYDRINKRVDKMLEQGLVNEVREILSKHKNFPTAMQGLGYKEVVRYINHEFTYEEMVEEIKQKTRNYAKRQLTWFKKNKDTIWLDGMAGNEENIAKIKETLRK